MSTHQPTYTSHNKIWTAISGSALVASGQVFNHHKVADMTLPSITVGVVDTGIAELADSGINVTGYIKNHTIRISIYGHTAWMEQDINHITTMQLMDDVLSALIENQDLGDEYFITGYSKPTHDDTFDESDTQGGRVDVQITVIIPYTKA